MDCFCNIFSGVRAVKKTMQGIVKGVHSVNFLMILLAGAVMLLPKASFADLPVPIAATPEIGKNFIDSTSPSLAGIDSDQNHKEKSLKSVAQYVSPDTAKSQRKELTRKSQKANIPKWTETSIQKSNPKKQLKSSDIAFMKSTQAVFSDSFEGIFPGAWDLFGHPTWAKQSYRKYSGAYSAYCVGDTISAPGLYTNNASSWLTYGPFSLENANSAIVKAKAWIRTELGYDFIGVYASLDDYNYYGQAFSGDYASSIGGSGWGAMELDLSKVPTLGNLLGKSQVWISFAFESDDIFIFEGAYIDDVVLEATGASAKKKVDLAPIFSMLLNPIIDWTVILQQNTINDPDPFTFVSKKGVIIPMISRIEGDLVIPLGLKFISPQGEVLESFYKPLTTELSHFKLTTKAGTILIVYEGYDSAKGIADIRITYEDGTQELLEDVAVQLEILSPVPTTQQSIASSSIITLTDGTTDDIEVAFDAYVNAINIFIDTELQSAMRKIEAINLLANQSAGRFKLILNALMKLPKKTIENLTKKIKAETDDEKAEFVEEIITLDDIENVLNSEDYEEPNDSCISATVSGGDAPHASVHNLGSVDASITVNWEMYTQKDALFITHNGVEIFTSGCMSNSGSKTGTYKPGWLNTAYSWFGLKQINTLGIRIFPNCEGGSGTAWNFSLNCSAL